MQIRYDASAGELTVMLTGEIDHHSAGALRAEVDAAIFANTPKTLILDFSRVSFMDSSGIGLIMGRYKILQPLGGEIVMQDPLPHISRILRLAGMERIARIRITRKETVS
jgi:stage II sporulation protein AA (anti-sigma F factor antagonist)